MQIAEVLPWIVTLLEVDIAAAIFFWMFHRRARPHSAVIGYFGRLVEHLGGYFAVVQEVAACCADATLISVVVVIIICLQKWRLRPEYRSLITMRLKLGLGWLRLVCRYCRRVFQVGHALLLPKHVVHVLLIRRQARVHQDRLGE